MRKAIVDSSGAEIGGEEVTAIGCFEMDTNRGPVHFCELPGFITTTMTTSAGAVVGMLIYAGPMEGEQIGSGRYAQMSAATARLVAGSLMKLANQIDPQGTN